MRKYAIDIAAQNKLVARTESVESSIKRVLQVVKNELMFLSISPIGVINAVENSRKFREPTAKNIGLKLRGGSR